eukprot:Gb_19121 [translate_table: standard]
MPLHFGELTACDGSWLFVHTDCNLFWLNPFSFKHWEKCLGVSRHHKGINYFKITGSIMKLPVTINLANYKLQSLEVGMLQCYGQAIFYSMVYLISATPVHAWQRCGVRLYNWFLIRVGEEHRESGIDHNGGQVAVGGYTTSDLLDCEKFTTAPIESRKEKCKLRTVDGLDVLLMGAIDEQSTYDNGFSFKVIHLFLTGFPFNWNHVVNKCLSQPSFDTSIPAACKIEDPASRDKDETPLSECPTVQMDKMGTNKSSLLESEENLSKVCSPRESSVRCHKRVRNESRPTRSSKRLKCSKVSTEIKLGTLPTLVGSDNVSGMSKEEESKLLSTKKSKAVTPHHNNLDIETYDHFHREDKSTVSGCALRMEKSPKRLNSRIGGGAVENEKDILKGSISGGVRESRECKKQIAIDSSLEEVKLIQTGRTVKIEDNGKNQTNNDSFTITDHGTHDKVDNREIDQSSFVSTQNGILEHSDNNCTPVSKQVLENQTPAQEFSDFGCKMRSGRHMSKSNAKTNVRGKKISMCRSASSEVSRGLLCYETPVKAGSKKDCDAIQPNHSELFQEITPGKAALDQTFEKQTSFSFDLEHPVLGHEKRSSDINGNVQDEQKSSADPVAIDGMQKKASSASAEKLSSQLVDNQLDNDANTQNRILEHSDNNCTPVSKHVLETQTPVLEFSDSCCKMRSGRRMSKSNAKTNGRGKGISKCRSASPEVSRRLLCDKDPEKAGSKNNSDAMFQEIMPGRATLDQTFEKETSFLFDLERPVLGCKKGNSDVNDNAQVEQESFADPVAIDGMQKKASSVSAEKPPPPLVDNQLDNDATEVEKHVSKSNTNSNTNRSSKSRRKHTDPSPKEPKGFVCNEATVKDDFNLKSYDLDATHDGNSNVMASESEHGTLSDHFTEVSGTGLKQNGDRIPCDVDRDSKQTEKSYRERNIEIQTGKRQNLMQKLPPPLPPRRVQTTPEEVSKAFGLKTSRSGDYSETFFV